MSHVSHPLQLDAEGLSKHCLLSTTCCVGLLLLARFELVAPPRFGLVCLRLKGVGSEGNRALLAAVNSAGTLSRTQLPACVFAAAFGNTALALPAALLIMR